MNVHPDVYGIIMKLVWDLLKKKNASSNTKCKVANLTEQDFMTCFHLSSDLARLSFSKFSGLDDSHLWHHTTRLALASADN